MKKINKLIIVSLLLILIGIGFTSAGFFLGGRIYGFGLNRDGLHVYTPGDNETTYTEETVALEAFNSIETDIEFLELKIAPQDNYSLSYKVNSQSDLSYEIEDGTLKISEQYRNTDNNMFDFHWFFFGSTNSSHQEKEYLEIYVPQNTRLHEISVSNDFADVLLTELTAESVSVQSDYANIEISELSVASLAAETESGKLVIADTTGNILSINNSYGDTELSGLQFDETADFTCESGCISIDNVAFHSWKADAQYGDIEGDTVSCDTVTLSLESSNCDIKDFTVHSLDAESEYGDISLRLTAPANTYSYELRTEYGSIDLEGYDTEDETTLITHTDSEKQIKINCESGNIKISGS